MTAMVFTCYHVYTFITTDDTKPAKYTLLKKCRIFLLTFELFCNKSDLFWKIYILKSKKIENPSLIPNYPVMAGRITSANVETFARKLNTDQYFDFRLYRFSRTKRNAFSRLFSLSNVNFPSIHGQFIKLPRFLGWHHHVTM